MDARLPGSGPRLVELTSASCPACVRMTPVVNAVERACPKERIVRVRVDEPTGSALAASYRVGVTPTYLLVDAEDREVLRLEGTQTQAKLMGLLEELPSGCG